MCGNMIFCLCWKPSSNGQKKYCIISAFRVSADKPPQATQAGFEPMTSCLSVTNPAQVACLVLFPQLLGKHRVYSVLYMAERSSALDSSYGVVRKWVRTAAWPVAALVSLSKRHLTIYFVLRMGRKAVYIGPVCCVMHVKEPRTFIVKEKGLAPVFLDSRLEHPAGWICARYKYSILLLLYVVVRAKI